jgi:predicted transcriptional regulator
MPYGDLERGWAKSRLILELAQQEKTQVQLAREYGVTQGSVSEFATRHADEITHQRSKIEDEWIGLWIADKRNRVAEAQADVDAINAALQGLPDDKLLRTKLAIMRQVAEELGQLRDIVEVGGKLTYIVQGVAPETLR